MPNNNNINGDKMILDVELTAKPITDEFWILTDGKNKVGNVCANNIPSIVIITHILRKV